MKVSSLVHSTSINNAIGSISNYTGQAFNTMSELLFKKWEIQYLVMAFLLGRAMILNDISPFVVPFFAVIYHLKKDKLIAVGFALLLGAHVAGSGQFTSAFGGIILFYLLKKYLEKINKEDLSYSPFLVMTAILIPRLTELILDNVTQLYPWLMVTIEGMLGFVLTLIFVQAMPIIVFKRDRKVLNQEEIVALIIVLASIMTGTLGWTIGEISIEHVVSRYFLLLLAYVGGGTIGASVGVVTGLILSLSNPNAVYQISLLAFSGLLAGLLKQGKKLGVGIGLLLGTTILSFYLGNQSQIIQSFNESIIAFIVFLLTPNKIVRGLSKYIPGTYENQNYYQDNVRKVKEITSKKIDQFSTMFSQMASSFKEINSSSLLDRNSEQLDHFIHQITESQCKTCWKRHSCWDENLFRTYQLVTELMTIIESDEKITKQKMPKEWLTHCVKPEQIAFQISEIYQSYGDHLYWKNQIEESRLLVAHQLFGVSKVMKDLAQEIKREGNELAIEEQHVQYSLERLGLSIRQVNILNLSKGNVEIEITQPNCNGINECDKVVAPLISEVIGENIIVKDKQCEYLKDGQCKVCLHSAKAYEVESGFANAAKGGKWVSGDSFTQIEINNKKIALALSDGMGNGERAQRESHTTIELLQQLLHSGIDETISIKTINSVLLLRSKEEIFSTIDLAIIDLFDGKARFLKVGSTPSFIKRGDEIITVSSNNLPVGILQDIDIDAHEYTLLPGDQLIMITDGIYESRENVNHELWMKRMIQEIKTDDPQEFADLILEKVIRLENGNIKDDMTVIVSNINEYKPEWSAIKVPGISKIERSHVIQ